MSWTFVECALIAFAYLGLFFLWGRTFLAIIHAKQKVASSVMFGYLILQVLFQLFYIPFFLTRGSYRGVAYSWLGVIAVLSVVMILYMRKHPPKYEKKIGWSEITGFSLAFLLILGIGIYISLHVPFYGDDTRTYITAMNNAYYKDTIWIASGWLSIHSGQCSMFHFFTIPSLLTGIKPYYIALFTVRIVGVCLFSFIVYHIGTIIFQKSNAIICWPALLLSVLAPFLLMFWGSNYTAEFFYWRINEAKGYCQFVLLPIGFSVFLEMFKYSTDRKTLWKKQLLVGLAAIPISSSSMTSYLFLLFMGSVALLLFDKLKNGLQTIVCSVICAIPNIVYLVIYILEGKGMISF